MSPGRRTLAISAGVTALGVLVALLGTATAVPAATWPRFWATLFFVLLLWPVGLAVIGRLAGVRVEVAVAALLLLLTLGQHAGRTEVPLPVAIRWWASLDGPGDTARHRIPLPAPGGAGWERAWRRAAGAAVVVCTESAAQPESSVSVSVGGEAPVPLTAFERLVVAQDLSWYSRPVEEATVLASAPSGLLDVVLQRGSGAGPAVRLCGGRDDPARPGAGGSERLVDGRWSARALADEPLPLVSGRPVLGRYYVELRFLDDRGRPTIDIWY